MIWRPGTRSPHYERWARLRGRVSDTLSPRAVIGFAILGSMGQPSERQRTVLERHFPAIVGQERIETRLRGERRQVARLAKSVQNQPAFVRRAVLDAAIDVATADRQLMSIANYGLRFLAALCGEPLAALSQRFRQRVGHALPALGDPSRAPRAKAGQDGANSQSQRRERTNVQRPAETPETPVKAAQRRLGVPKDADAAVVRRAYRRRIHQVHPDRHVGADARTLERATADFRQAQADYELLIRHA